MLRFVFFAGLMSFLAACATLTENECASVDWYELGVQDGAHGRLATYFSRHVKACAKHGIVPQQTPWKEGREDGLRLFCIPDRAYSIGKAGSQFPTVCTVDESIEMRPAYDWGRQYHFLTEEINELQLGIDARLEELATLEDPEDPLFEIYAQYNWRDERRMRRLTRKRDRYQYWPPRF